MVCGPDGNGQLTNSFALVAYIPDPLARFLDDLRRELVPGCVPRAHVTILPPRPVSIDPSHVASALGATLEDFGSFEVEGSELGLFQSTQVIYIELGRGGEELQRLHDALNTGPVAFQEPYPYHPHITLAQDIPAASVPGVFARAYRAWAECSHPRGFMLDTVTFVRNQSPNTWLDLNRFSLNALPSVR